MLTSVKSPQITPWLIEKPIIHYPDSDGKPMAENDPHYFCISDTRFALATHFAPRPDIYIAADMLIYYVEGEPKNSVAPDLFVTFGIPAYHRRTFRLWDEGKAPDVVFEFASEGTWRADVGWKRGLYMGIGIREYFLFDPFGLYLNPILQGYRFIKDGTDIENLPQLTTARGEVGLYSPLLGLELWAITQTEPRMPYALRLFDPQQKAWLRTPAETETARRDAEVRAATAEKEIARLQAELEKIRGPQ